MSLDFQLAWPCPHTTIEEVVPLSADRMSLRVRQPIGGANSVRIMVNDDPDLFIPKNGFRSAAYLTSAVSGPFDIHENEDTLIVETSGGTASLTFGVRGVVRRTTDQVVSLIQRAGWQHVVVTNDAGLLAFVDSHSAGSSAFVKVRGSIASALGFGQPNVSNRQWVAYGRDVYPGWDLYMREDEIVNRYVRFRAPIQSNPMFKVTYRVPLQQCLRCQATYVENDYRFDMSGDSIFVSNEDLLQQAALKILLTERGSNPFHPWYGTTIKERIGSKALMGVSSVLTEDIRQALGRMQSLQAAQGKVQQVSFKERLYNILSVSVKKHQQDITAFMIDVTVQNGSGDPITLNTVFTVPEVVALMGSNGLMAGLGPNDALTSFRNDRNILTGGQ